MGKSVYLVKTAILGWYELMKGTNMYHAELSMRALVSNLESRFLSS